MGASSATPVRIMDWFSLSLLCAFSLATADALTKKAFSGQSALELLLIRFVVPAILLLPVLWWYPLPVVPVQFWAWLAVLVPLELLAMLLYMQAIRDAPFCQTLPYLAFTPVFNIITAWLVLGEQVSLAGGAGIALVVAGAYLLNSGAMTSRGWRAWYEPFYAITYSQGSRRMLLAALIYSLTSVGSKAAMLQVGPLTFGAFYFAVLGLATLLLVCLKRPSSLRVFSYRPGWLLLVGVMMAMMVFTHFLAIAQVEAAYMVAVKRTSLLFGLLYGAWLFQEAGLAKHLLSGLMMVAGAALILFA